MFYYISHSIFIDTYDPNTRTFNKRPIEQHRRRFGTLDSARQFIGGYNNYRINRATIFRKADNKTLLLEAYITKDGDLRRVPLV